MVTHDEAMLPPCDKIIENKKVVSKPVPENTKLI